jgi:hypothetical protein
MISRFSWVSKCLDEFVIIAVQPHLVSPFQKTGHYVGIRLGHHARHIKAGPAGKAVQHVQHAPQPLAHPEAAGFQ